MNSISSLIGIFKRISAHPLTKHSKSEAIVRFLKWQISSRLNPYPIVYPFTSRSSLLVSQGMTGATANIYCGLDEYEEMIFLLHFLRPEDLFIDVGANIGSYTILASAHVGARSISFEPIASTFHNLSQNIHINKIQDKVKAINIGLGAVPGKMSFTNDIDTTNHVAIDGEENIVQVSIETLDEVLKDEDPVLVKIDVEGFETEVLKGGIKTISKESVKAIIIELNGLANRYGFDQTEIQEKLHELGFDVYSYNPAEKSFVKGDNNSHNSIYIRDIAFVSERVKNSVPTTILNQSV